MPPLVFFDLDNTLLDRVGVFRRWATQWPFEQQLDVKQAVPWLEEEDGDGLVPREELFARAKERFSLPDRVDVLVELYDRTYPSFVGPAPQLLTTALSALRDNGYRIGIVTNGPPSQEIKIARMEFGDLVDGWAVSALVGANKPSPSIFHAAASACGVADDTWWEGGWMVGDNAEADIGGAQASHLRSIWLHQGRDWPGGLPKPDGIASGIPEAVELILASD